MTPFPNGEGSCFDSGVLSNPWGVIVPQLEPVVDKKIGHPDFLLFGIRIKKLI
jgi:hypothetical protein